MQKLTCKQLTEIASTQQAQINGLLNYINAYINFKGDSEKFDKYLKELRIKNEKQRAEKEKEAK